MIVNEYNIGRYSVRWRGVMHRKNYHKIFNNKINMVITIKKADRLNNKKKKNKIK